MCEVEVFVIVDECDNYVCHSDSEKCLDAANDAGLVACRRLIRVKLNVPLPCAMEVEATLPAESGGVFVNVK